MRLCDTLIESPPGYEYGAHRSHDCDTTFTQHFADGRAQHLFDSIDFANYGRRNFDSKAPAYNCVPDDAQRSYTHELPATNPKAIIEHEKRVWSSRFECAKWLGGVYAAHRWAPQCMPPEISPTLIDWQKEAGFQHLYFGGPTHSEVLKELKSRYVAKCIGSMALGWTASHLTDNILFPEDQYLEGTLVGDVSGIALAIKLTDWRRKALAVAATHFVGKTIDHWFQLHY